MATKTITITTKAYHILKSRKREHESFSDVITRMGKSGNRALLKLVGLFSKEDADTMEKVIREGRDMSKKRMDRIVEEFRK